MQSYLVTRKMGRRTCYYLGQQLTTENGAALAAVQSALFQCKSTGATSHHDRRTGLGCPAFDPRVQCTGSTGLTLKNNPRCRKNSKENETNKPNLLLVKKLYLNVEQQFQCDTKKPNQIQQISKFAST